LAIAAGLLFWLLAAGWLSAPLLDAAQHDAQPAQSGQHPDFSARNAIVLLGGGTEYDGTGRLVPKRDVFSRIATAADLYAQCRRLSTVCHVIVSGGNPQRHVASEADTCLPYLLRSGVPRPDIILENASRTTYENAAYVTAILNREHYSSSILITSAYHMPRALLDFQRFGYTPQPIVSNTRRVRPGVLPRYGNLVDAELALHELIGIVQFHVYRAIGWF
jgi:uncharacterized SAM-binding protein YcdF (DUF218 family)